MQVSFIKRMISHLPSKRTLITVREETLIQSMLLSAKLNSTNLVVSCVFSASVLTTMEYLYVKQYLIHSNNLSSGCLSADCGPLRLRSAPPHKHSHSAHMLPGSLPSPQHLQSPVILCRFELFRDLCSLDKLCVFEDHSLDRGTQMSPTLQ